jgi:hypothetical protein
VCHGISFSLRKILSSRYLVRLVSLMFQRFEGANKAETAFVPSNHDGLGGFVSGSLV